jgi:hypothetical protein
MSDQDGVEQVIKIAWRAQGAEQDSEPGLDFDSAWGSEQGSEPDSAFGLGLGIEGRL